jgi:hypothetical protein
MDAKTMAARASKASENALIGMLEGLSASADEATKNSDAYQHLAAQPHVTAVLSEAVHQMNSIAVNVSKVLRDQHGIQIDRPGYKLIKALAWHNEDITEEAKSLNDPNWSARGVWEIERILRESAPWTDPNGARDLIRVSTQENSADFIKAVTALIRETGMDSDDATEEVKTILGALRGAPYATEAEVAEAGSDPLVNVAVEKGNKGYFSAGEQEENVTTNPETADDEAPYDPDGNWVKYLTPEQLEAAEAHAKKTPPAPQPVIEDEWKMQNRGGW